LGGLHKGTVGSEEILSEKPVENGSHIVEKWTRGGNRTAEDRNSRRDHLGSTHVSVRVVQCDRCPAGNNETRARTQSKGQIN